MVLRASSSNQQDRKSSEEHRAKANGNQEQARDNLSKRHFRKLIAETRVSLLMERLEMETKWATMMMVTDS